MMCSSNNEGQKGKKSINEQVKQIFFILLLLIIFILSLTLFSFYKSSSFAFDEYDSLKDIHVLKSKIYTVNKGGDPHDITGKITITEISDNLVLINGEIFNLSPGTTHGFHIVDFIDFDTPSKAFSHFNPYNEKHSCPSNQDSPYHAGDLGNVIADSKGVAKFNFEKKMSIKSISGRGIVLLKGEDLCNENQTVDKFEDIIGYGVISVGNYQKKAEIDVKQNWMIKEYNKRKIEQNKKIEIKNKENTVLPNKPIEFKKTEIKQPLDTKPQKIFRNKIIPSPLKKEIDFNAPIINKPINEPKSIKTQVQQSLVDKINNEKVITNTIKEQAILKVQPTEMRYKEKNISIKHEENEKIKNVIANISEPLPQKKENLIQKKNEPKIIEVKQEEIVNIQTQKSQDPISIIARKDEIKEKKVKSNINIEEDKTNTNNDNQEKERFKNSQSRNIIKKENEVKQSNLIEKKEIKPINPVDKRNDSNIIKKLIKSNESKEIKATIIDNKKEITLTNPVNNNKKELLTPQLNSKSIEKDKLESPIQNIKNGDKKELNKMKSIDITEKKEEKQNQKRIEKNEKSGEEQKKKIEVKSETKEKEIQQAKPIEVKIKEETNEPKKKEKEINQTKLNEKMEKTKSNTDKKEEIPIKIDNFEKKDIISKKKEEEKPKLSTIDTQETKKEKSLEKIIIKPEKKEVNANIEKIVNKETVKEAKIIKPDVTKNNQEKTIKEQKLPEIKKEFENQKQKENEIEGISIRSKQLIPSLKKIITNNVEEELNKHQKINKDNSNDGMIIPKIEKKEKDAPKIEKSSIKIIPSSTQNQKNPTPEKREEKPEKLKIENSKENIKKEEKKPKEFYLPMNPPVTPKNKTSVTFYNPTQLKEEMAKRNLVFPGTPKKNEKVEKLGTVTITESNEEKESTIKVIERNEKEGRISIVQHISKENEKNEVNKLLNKKLQNAPIGYIEFIDQPESHPELNISEEVIYPRATNLTVILNNYKEPSPLKFYIPAPSKEDSIPSVIPQEKKNEKENKLTDDFTFFIQSKSKNIEDKLKDPTIHFLKPKVQEKSVNYYLDKFKNELSKMMNHRKN